MMKKMVFSVTVLMMIFLFAGCQGKMELKAGKYYLEGKSDSFSYVLLNEEGHFEFHRGVALSYLPMGTYEVEGEKLILKANDTEAYHFVIHGDELIFQGEIEGILKNGSRFLLEEANK